VEGTCWSKPRSCPPDIVPVCGCDGKSYANDCERQAAGVSKRNDGVYSSPSCPGTVPTQGASCTPANSPCTYNGPTYGCVQRFSCVSSHWSAPTIVCNP
jgi:hypothetical protein